MFPNLSELVEVLILAHYNTRVVVLSTTLLGCASGIVGTFLLMRKRSLMGDTLSHATLPGIAIAFLALTLAGKEGKSLPALLLGAIVFGVLGFLAVMLIRQYSRLKDDAAMGIVLSVFFGAGISLMGIIQSMPEASAAGLSAFIYGKTASIVWIDFLLILGTMITTILVVSLLFKELRLLCFDEGFAAAQGWPTKLLDIILLAMVTAITVVGLKAVGLILMISFLIIPAASASYWTHSLRNQVLLSALFGSIAGWMGSSVSALYPNMPAGAIIVLVSSAIFTGSLLWSLARKWRMLRMTGHPAKGKEAL